MKTLKESLLDIEGTISDNSALYNTQLTPDSNFIKSIFYDNGLSRRNTSDIRVYNPAASKYDSKTDTLYIDINIMNLTSYALKDKISDLFPGIKRLVINGFLRVDNYLFNRDSICDEVVCQGVMMSFFRDNGISDIKVTVTDKPEGPWRSAYRETKSPRIKCNICGRGGGGQIGRNTEINIIETGFTYDINSMRLTFDNIPNLSNLSSNVEAICLHNSSIFDDEENVRLLYNIIDLNHVCMVNGEERKMNSIKKLIATINNPKKYPIDTNMIATIPGTSIVNTLGLKKLKNIKAVEISNNNVSLLFTNDITIIKYIVKNAQTHRTGTTVPNALLSDISNIPMTDDGWYIFGWRITSSMGYFI